MPKGRGYKGGARIKGTGLKKKDQSGVKKPRAPKRMR